MKKTLTTVILFISCAALMAQFADAAQQSAPVNPKRAAITVGFLQGGGSLIGADLEFLVTPKLGLQAGAGYIGFGGSVNYHLKPVINSSFVSIGYWHQGMAKLLPRMLWVACSPSVQINCYQPHLAWAYP